MGRQNNYGNRDQDNVTVDYEAIIVRGDIDVTVEAAQQIAPLIKKVSSNQMRGFFTAVRQIQIGWEAIGNESDPARIIELTRKAEQAYRSIILMKPRLRYAAERNRDSLKPLDTYLINCINHISGETPDKRRARFLNFADFFESLIAFHKAAGGAR